MHDSLVIIMFEPIAELHRQERLREAAQRMNDWWNGESPLIGPIRNGGTSGQPGRLTEPTTVDQEGMPSGVGAAITSSDTRAGPTLSHCAMADVSPAGVRAGVRGVADWSKNLSVPLASLAIVRVIHDVRVGSQQRAWSPGHRLVADQFRRDIAVGLWRAGQPVPAESVLVDDYGVALRTVRHALAVLNAEGVLEHRHGKLFVIPDAAARADTRVIVPPRLRGPLREWLAEQGLVLVRVSEWGGHLPPTYRIEPATHPDASGEPGAGRG